MDAGPSARTAIRAILGVAFTGCVVACSFSGPGGEPLARLPAGLTGGVVPGDRVKKLLHVADAEWRRWGGQVVRIPTDDPICAIVVSGECKVIEDGCGKEQTVALCAVVNEFWTHIRLASGEDFNHGCSRTGVCEHTLPAGAPAEKTPGWSAAFISTLLHRAGFTAGEFLPSPFHANYVVAARDGQTTAYAVAPTPAYVEPGDIVCTTRFADRPQLTPEEIELLTPNGLPSRATPMHCDLVVAVDLSQRLAHAVGGNVMQAVSMNQIDLDGQGRLSPLVNPGRRWLLVMKLRPEVRAGN
ncbi:MAG: DUF2272 domain-containing protein [Lautropia sp.]|nr:DUF2272 domain-containing protein [Lautropia sp.]